MVDRSAARSTGNGETGSTPQPVHDTTDTDTDSGEDTEPRVATDGNQWVAVWQSTEDGGSGKDSDILFATF